MILAIYLIGILPAWFIAAGWLFSDLQCSYPSIAKSGRREDAGFSAFCGAIAGLFWPLLLPMIWCITGFAEHGIWRSPKC